MTARRRSGLWVEQKLTFNKAQSIGEKLGQSSAKRGIFHQALPGPEFRKGVSWGDMPIELGSGLCVVVASRRRVALTMVEGTVGTMATACGVKEPASFCFFAIRIRHGASLDTLNRNSSSSIGQ